MLKKNINIIHAGPGKVGKAFIRQLYSQKKELEGIYNINIKFIGVINSIGAVFNKNGISIENLINQYLRFPEEYFFKNDLEKIDEYVLKNNEIKICVDTSASDKTIDLFYKVLKNKGFVVMSNKLHMASNIKEFNKLNKYKSRIFYETTVGAGLPVISTIKELIETGDKIIKIEGAFSGTLSYIFSSLDRGAKFSDAVNEAYKEGYTEPDPRDDLSGKDVARKVLILARTLGQKIDIDKISIQNLYSQTLNKLTVNEFLNKVSIINNKYDFLLKKGKKNNSVLRYSVLMDKSNTIKLNLYKKDSDLGSLKGTDNIFIIKTKRYLNNPIVIKGPGAGIEVTAAGVLGDLIKIFKMIQ